MENEKRGGESIEREMKGIRLWDFAVFAKSADYTNVCVLSLSIIFSLLTLRSFLLMERS